MMSCQAHLSFPFLVCFEDLCPASAFLEGVWVHTLSQHMHVSPCGRVWHGNPPCGCYFWRLAAGKFNLTNCFIGLILNGERYFF